MVLKCFHLPLTRHLPEVAEKKGYWDRGEVALCRDCSLKQMQSASLGNQRLNPPANTVTNIPAVHFSSLRTASTDRQPWHDHAGLSQFSAVPLPGEEQQRHETKERCKASPANKLPSPSVEPYLVSLQTSRVFHGAHLSAPQP